MFKKLIEKIRKLFELNLFDEAQNLVMYICGNESLPEPLEAEEELVLIEELSNGNSYAREKLIEHNLRLVVYIAKKFENTNIYIEDLISIGTIGLIKAVNTFRPD
ncbi:MAG: RNA polymerase sporulation sigma factor SigE, partial [Clostridia bacterium]|nr:RNA polymerase sporulation sigma factor SigE [Clostridia bacterium]